MSQGSNTTPASGAKGVAGRLAMLFAQNPRLILIFVGLAVVAGLGAMQALPRQEDPSLSPRFATVITAYPGAAPERVEALVTDPIEDALREIDELVEMASTSRTGLSVITLELEESITDVEPIWSELRDKLDDVTPDLPVDAGVPEFEKQLPEAEAFLIALRPVRAGEAGNGVEGGDVVSKALVQRLAESLEEQVARLPGTKETTLFGVTEEEITVTYDPAVLASYGLTPEGVASAIEASDAKATAGSLHGSGRQLTLEVAGDLTGTARIAEIPLKMLADGSVLRVGMVADIRKGLKQPLDSLALVDGQEAVFVSARMKQSQRIDLWSAQMHELVEGFQSGLPQGVAAEVMFDQSRYTSDRLSGLTVNLAVGILLVMAVLMVMMGLRSALLVGVALPLTLTMALFCFHLIGVPMHQMSVTGLIIALGLLIDNAIVTVDEFDRRRAKGATPLEAVQRTVNHLAIPLLASTTTTVLAFLPIVLMPGAAGEFVGTMGLAVILCVVISLSLAVTVIPAVASIVDRLLERRGAKAATGELEVGMPRRRPGIHLPGLSRRYRGLLGFLFRHPLLGLALGLALPIAGFVVAPTLPGQFFPPTERDQFQVQLRMSGESSLQDTRAAVERARAVLERYPEIQHDLWVIGENPPMVYYNTIFSSDNDPSFAGGFVVTESPEATGRILVSLQAALAEALPEAEILALPFEQGPPFDAPVEVELYGPDLAELERLGEEIRRVLADTPGVTFTRTTIGTGRPKLEFQADETLVAAAGFTLDGIARALRARQDGLTGGTVLEGTEELPVRVRAMDAVRGDPQSLSAMPLSRPNASSGTGADLVPLSALGTLRLTGTVDAIQRMNGERRTRIQGFLVAFTLPSEVVASFNQRLAEAGVALPGGYRLKTGGEGAESAQAQGQLMAIFLPLMVLMVGTVVLAFNSFRQGAVIMTVGGLSMGLAFLSIWVAGYPMGFMAIVGGMGLLGVAINDSIVVMSTLREDPKSMAGDPDAVADRVMEGSRHVFSTTMTTIGGFFPLLLFGGAFWGPLASAIAGGMIGATLLALLFVPSAHLLFQRGGRSARSDGGAPSKRSAPILPFLRGKSAPMDPSPKPQAETMAAE